jgi:hypothetical protein
VSKIYNLTGFDINQWQFNNISTKLGIYSRAEKIFII